jgi:hypothetical protein
MVSQALKEYGFRVEAAFFDKLHLKAMTSASKAYANGDTPAFLIQHLKQKWPPNGVPPGSNHEEIERAVRAEIDNYYRLQEQSVSQGVRRNPAPTGPGTNYELYGIHVNSQGQEVAGYGTEVRSDGTLHGTRGGGSSSENEYGHEDSEHDGWGFGGWGSSVPLTADLSLAQDAVKAYKGPDEGLGNWLLTRLQDPSRQVGENPAFQPLMDYLKKNPKITPSDFKAQLARFKTPTITRQMALLRKGYVEVSPVLDPGKGQTAFANFSYDGTRYVLKIDYLENGSVRLTVQSPKPIRMQFNQNWARRGDTQGVNEAQRSSEIFEIGGSNSSITLWP